MILNDDEKVVLISEDMTLGNDLVGKITLELHLDDSVEQFNEKIDKVMINSLQSHLAQIKKDEDKK